MAVPVSCANSPSCGVRTVAAVRSARPERDHPWRSRAARHRRRRPARRPARSPGGSTQRSPPHDRDRDPPRAPDSDRGRRALRRPTRRRGATAATPRAAPVRSRRVTTPPRARRRSAPRRRAAQTGGAEHAGRPGDDPHRGRPLVGVDRPPRQPRRHIAGLDEMAGGPRHVEPDVDDVDLARQRRPVTEQQARLQRLERDRAVGGQHRAGVFVRSTASRPLGMSTASTGRPPIAGGVQGARHDARYPVP